MNGSPEEFLEVLDPFIREIVLQELETAFGLLFAKQQRIEAKVNLIADHFGLNPVKDAEEFLRGEDT